MNNKSIFQFFAVIILCLLASCTAETIPLASPTPWSAEDTLIPATTEVPQSEVTPTESPQPSLTVAVQDMYAQIIELTGEGRRRTSRADIWVPASILDTLQINNEILTATEAKAVIEYLDGVTVYVAPKTLFIVRELKTSGDGTPWAAIQLMLGQLFISHQGEQDAQIRVESTAGIAGVRGSMMSVRVTLAGRMVVTCMEGICTLENESGLITLAPGQQAELLGAGTAPVLLGTIADYQLNDWFANVPAALQVVLDLGLLEALPDGCSLADSQACQIDIECDPDTGTGCLLPEGCDPATGSGCELPGGCNLITGEGCDLPTTCDPQTGAGCELVTGCNPVTNTGCQDPLSCNPLSGEGCPTPVGCNQQTGEGCELDSGCNPVTGEGCVETANLPADIATALPDNLTETLATEVPKVIPAEIPPVDQGTVEEIVEELEEELPDEVEDIIDDLPWP